MVNTDPVIRHLDSASRIIVGTGGALIALRVVVGSLQICPAGANCPPTITGESIITFLFGIVLLYVAFRFQDT